MPHSPREILERLGPHPATRAGLDPASDADSLRWLALALLLATRTDESRALAALRALATRELADPAGLAAADPEEVAALLTREGVRQPEATAAVLLRACRAFAERWHGSVARMASGADDLADLGARVAGLASGVGAATVARFLRPLRERFPAAREIPLAASARAAAQHLGWIAEGDDEEGEPAVLRKWLAQTPDAPPLPDLEAALERLGSAACLRERSARCPLGEACPLRAGAHPVSSADGFD